MQQSQTVAKIARPDIRHFLPRERLFRMLDNCRGSVIWISAPAGSGKTTLAASYLTSRKLPCLWYQVDARDGDIASFFYYMGLAAKKAAPRKRNPLPLLTPEYFLGLPTFILRYFEDLYSRLRPPFVIVFDNYQDAPLESKLHEVIGVGLGIVPKGIKIIIVSRGEPSPSPAISRLRAGNKVTVIGWNEIRFTLDESRRLIRAKGRSNLSAATLKDIFMQADGWAAGLLLTTEVLKTRNAYISISFTHAPQEVFDYFAGELFDKTTPEMKDFLLRTSFLPHMTVAMARQLTGVSHSGRILSFLCRNHFFTIFTRESAYLYHPLFRMFLQARAGEVFSSEVYLALQSGAADVLKTNGYTEDAVELMIETGDWHSVVESVLERAPALARQGRFQILDSWLVRIPDELLNSMPWLQFWLGTCRLPFSPSEGRMHLEAAFRLFKTEKNHAGLLLSCSSIIETYIYEWDDFSMLDTWIGELGDLLGPGKDIPSADIEMRAAFAMLGSLIFRQPSHPELPKWTERVNAIMRDCRDINYRVMLGNMLTTHYSWTGQYAEYKVILDELRPSIKSSAITPIVKIMWYSMQAIYFWATASFDKCEESISDGVRTTVVSGVHIYDSQLYAQGAYNAIISGDPEASAEYLKKMKAATDLSKLTQASHYNYLMGWDAFSRGELSEALAFCRAFQSLQKRGGMYFARGANEVLAAQILFEAGDYEGASGCLAGAREVGLSMRSMIIQFVVLLVEAYFSFAKDGRAAESRGRAALKKAMALGRKENLMYLNGLRRVTSAFLCAKALESGIETAYVRRLISVHRLIPDPLSLHIQDWPWTLKVYTFGQFTIIRDGKPLLFSGKVQKKPLDMLKLLVALGGMDISDERIAGALWPDADGATAHQSYETTLHRLRKLIGVGHAIQRQEGRITLNPGLWWADLWAFERIIEDYEEKGQRSALANAGRATERAISLYKGQFLAGDGDKQWLIPARERLRSKFLRTTAKAGQEYEQSGDWDKAVECYRKTLEADAYAEEFYQRLMTCFLRFGRKAEALAVYNRCRNVLYQVFGIGPSPKTEDLYLSIKQK
ncbi:MAG: BTAD domain-containing putative transcriptional regulator [Nitrospiraceae bacterium]|nr:BTAD domain-containing putative transcriptional regulator [Nitrospiraceae bacterium]